MTSPAMTMLEPHASPALETAPHVIVRGDGVRVWDSAGSSYLDATSGMLCTNLGYSQSRLVRAAAQQMTELPFCALYGDRTNGVALALADDLASIAPIPMGRTFFANSGAEAVDSAILAPPLISTAAEITETTDRLRAAYDAVVGAALPRTGR